MNDFQTLYTIPQFSEKHPFTTIGGLRALVFQSETNGFNKVIKRIGRRVLLDESAYFAWVEEQNNV